MKPLTTRQKISAIRALLSGSSVLEASKRLGISSGSISNTFAEFREGSFAPAGDVTEQVDQLRETAILLKKANLSLGQCLVGAIVLSDIRDSGLDPADIRRLCTVTKSLGADQDVQKFIDTVRHIGDVETRQGLTIEELEEKVSGLETKASSLQPLIEKRNECEREVNELTKHREELLPTVDHLEEKHKLLTRHVNNLEKREDRLTVQLKSLRSKTDKAEKLLADADEVKKEVIAAGLSIEGLSELSRRVRTVAERHNIFESDLRTRLFDELEKLEQELGFEKLIRANQTKLDAQNKHIAEGQEEHTRLMAAIGALKKDKVKLESGITEIKQNIADEISKLAPLATDSLNNFLRNLQSSQTETFNRLKEQEVQHGKIGLALHREEDVMILHLEKTRLSIEQAQKRALESVEKVTQDMAKDIRTWGDKRAELKTRLDDLEFAQYFTSIPLTREAMDRLVENINLPVVIQYLAIVSIFCSKNLNIKMRPPNWIIKKYYPMSEYTDVESVDLIKWAIEYFI